MTKPLPPIIHGPINPMTAAVRVTAVAPNATVDLVVVGASVGSASSSMGGTLWVSVSGPLVAGQSMTARQTTPGGVSDESANAVTVIDLPDPLPTPVFVSPLSVCMSRLKLDGLVPAATVTVRQGATAVGQLVAGQSSDFVDINPAATIIAGTRLDASQDIVVDGTTLSSPHAISLPVPSVNREQALPPPGVGQPIVACRTALDFFGMTPSADVVVNNNGRTSQWLNVASSYNGWGAPPFEQGKLVARQRFPRCDMESKETVVPVGPPQAPGKITIQPDPCPKLRRVHLSGLIPSSLVVLSTVEPDPTTPGAVVLTPIGEATASSFSEDFDLPVGIEPSTATGAPVLLTATQTLCGLTSPDALRVGFATPAGPSGPPVITSPVYECARRVAVTGAHPSRLLQPFDVGSGAPIGDAVLAQGFAASLALWFPLAAGRQVEVRQFGCGADGRSSAEPVKGLPTPLPSPQILEPVRPRAAGVGIKGCIPGARVHLLLNNVVRKSIDTQDTDVTVPTADLVLAEDDALWAVQTLCAHESSIEGVPVRVKKGDMALAVQPASVQRGTTQNVKVSATDADTGEPIIGAQILLNGAPVGKTGTPFAFAPTAGQANPAGVVKEPTAHNDAAFSITLTDPPPKPKGRLSLNLGPTVLIPNVLRLVSASWTVRPMWSPVQSFTATSANTSVTLPDPPPAPADQRVSVVLQSTWEVAGTINGIPFQHQTFAGHMNPNPTPLAWAGKDLTAGWLVLWEISQDDDGNPWLIVVTNFQSAF
jgi:hypothetical protein